jgi:cytochrome d ubiquinol oxidase subunit I
LLAYDALQKVRADKTDTEARAVFDAHWQDLGYALLLKRHVSDMTQVTDEQIAQAAWDTVPQVAPLFWSFRIMVALGFYFIAFFAVAFFLASKDRITNSKRFLKVALWTIPLPWIAIECGWFVAEFGRQPWIIEGVLPTYYAASGLSVTDLVISMAVFMGLYTTLAVIGIKVMLHSIRKGPDEHSPEPNVPLTPQTSVLGAE